MYVDRIRFADEPEALALASDGPFRALVRRPRAKVGMLARILRFSPEILRAYRALGNRESKAVFRDLLKYRVLGPYFTRIANNRALHEAQERVLAEDIPSEPTAEPLTDMLGQDLALLSISYRGRPVKVIGSKFTVHWVRDSSQYYYQEGDVAVQPEEGDVLLDGGAFLGEVSVRFALDVGETGRVYAFDPFPKHAAIARDVAALNGLEDRIEFVAAGLGAASSVASLDELSDPVEAQGAGGPNAGRRVTADDRMVAVDDFCRWRGLERVDYIKMDVEGSEIAALNGADATIARWRPKLAICVYHRYDDLWKITNLIRERYPFYDLYLDHYTVHAEETVLYAIARKR